jgi:hypothetical protein
MVSSLVVFFAMVELLILPFRARAFLADQPLVAAAWMGLAVKTDGDGRKNAAAAVARGVAVESYRTPARRGRRAPDARARAACDDACDRLAK